MHGMTEALKAGTTLPPGVYFGLDEERYHLDPALGSSDHRNLLLSPQDYWWGSTLNPHREEDDDESTPAKLRGTAMHMLVLQGEGLFGRRYARGPDHDKTMTPSEKGQLTKAAKARLEREGLGRELIVAKDYDRIVIASAMITRNPKLQRAFLGGIPEVSVFWQAAGGIGCKARLDYLKPRGVGDLKSITNMKKVEFRRACREAVANYRYDVQAEHYLEARSQIPRLVGDGLVHGDYDPELLQAVVEETKWAFQFVFFQASKAPVTYSVVLSPENPVLEVARRSIEVARENYRRFMGEFGPDNIWLLLDDPAELTIDELPPWWARD